MNDRDAQELVRMVESNWHFDLGEAGRKMWRQEIMMYPAEIATKALGHLARRANYKIVLADFTQTADMLSRNQREEARRAADAKALEQGRRGYACPEWVHVWAWDRNRKVVAWEKHRVPHKDRQLPSLPQMQDWGDPEQRVTQDEYEAMREEWVAAGSPKDKLAKLVEAI